MANNRVEAAAVRAYGPADNAAFFDKYLTRSPYFSDLFVCAVNNGAFRGNFLEDKAVYMAYLAWYGRGVLLNDTPPSTENVLVGTWGDLLAPNMDQARIMPQEDARVHLINCVVALFSRDAHANIAPTANEDRVQAGDALGRAWAMFELAAGVPANKPAAGAGGAPLARTDAVEARVGENGIITLLYAGYGGHREEQPTLDAALRVLSFLAGFISNAYKRSGPIGMLTSVLVSVSKRGQMSTDYSNKIREGIRADFGDNNITFNERPCEIFWKTYGVAINDRVIEQVVNRWIAATPESAVRLRTTLQQAKYQGLTVYCMIGKAIRKFQQFKWGVVQRMFAAEWTNYQAALTAVGNNAWYGYRKDLGAAKSTNFPSLAWIAKNLLNRVGGDANIMRYRGGVTRIEFQAQIEQLITNLEQTRGQEIDLEEGDRIEEVTTVINAVAMNEMFV